jgi:hypothetical protein
MTNLNKFTSGQYEEFKKRTLESGIVRKTITYGQFKLLSEQFIELVTGQTKTVFEISAEAFKDLIKLSGLSNTQFNKINATLGEKAGQNLLKLMQTALSSEPGKNTLCMLVNKTTTRVEGFVKSAQGVLSNQAFFALFEDVMNNHKGMEIKNMSVSNTGNVEISVLNKNWEFNVAGLNDEFFHSGIALINTHDATIINPFNERLTCTNGMVVTEKGLSLILKNSDTEKVNGFYDAVRNLGGVLEFETAFKQRVIRMMNSVASYAELKDCHSAVSYEVIDMTNPDNRNIVESFLPVREIYDMFMLKHRVNLSEVDNKMYKKIRTGLTVWDLVNNLTDLSSHPEKYSVNLRHGNSSVFNLQRKAGELSFKENYDLEMTVPQIF